MKPLKQIVYLNNINNKILNLCNQDFFLNKKCVVKRFSLKISVKILKPIWLWTLGRFLNLPNLLI